MANLPKCYALRSCTAPPVRVMLGEGGESVATDICALHIRGAEKLGFLVTVTCAETLVTSVITPGIRSLAERYGERVRVYRELTCAPSAWCKNGCKVHAALRGKSWSFKLIHNRTYGCAAGVR